MMKKAIVISIVVELITFPILVLTMGHAGPEGSLAPLGIVPFLIHWPAILLFSLLPFHPDSMPLSYALILLIQMFVLAALILLLMSLFDRTRKT